MKEDHQQAIEEKDAALALLTDDLQGWDNQIQAIQYENVALQAQRAKTLSSISKHIMQIMREIPVKTTLSSLYRNTKRLPIISIIICHIMSRGYKDVKGMFN